MLSIIAEIPSRETLPFLENVLALDVEDLGERRAGVLRPRFQ